MRRFKAIFLSLFSLAFALSGYSQSLKKLDSKAQTALEREDLLEALTYWEKSQKVARRKFGEKSLAYANRLAFLGTNYMLVGRLARAEKVLLQALKIDSLLEPMPDSCLGSHLDLLLQNYQLAGKFDKEILIGLKTLVLIAKKNGKSSNEYLIRSLFIALLAIQTGKNEIAKKLSIEAHDITNTMPDANDTLVNQILLCRAMACLGQLEYFEAVKFGDQLIRSDLDLDLPDTLVSFHYKLLGFAHYKLKNYDQSEQYFKNSWELDSIVFGIKSIRYSESLRNRAMIYLEITEYRRAEHNLLKALSIDSTVFGSNQFYYFHDLGMLGRAYSALAQYEIAESLFIKVVHAKPILERSDPTVYRGYLSELFGVYLFSNKLDSAIKTIRQIMVLDSTRDGTFNESYSNDLGNLGLALKQNNQFEESEYYLRRAIAIDSTLHIDSTCSHAARLGILALALEGRNHFEKAKDLLSRAQKIIMDQNCSGMGFQAKMLFNLGHVCLMDSSIELLSTTLPAMIAAINGSISPNLVGLDWEGENSLLHENENMHTLLHSSLFRFPKELSQLTQLGMNSAFFQKELILRSNKSFRKSLQNNSDKTITVLYDSLLLINGRIARLAIREDAASADYLHKLRVLARGLETNLLERSGKFATVENVIDLDTLAETIKPKMALVEYISYAVIDSTGNKKKSYFGAYVMRHGDSIPQIVKICAYNDLLTALKALYPLGENQYNQAYLTRGGHHVKPSSKNESATKKNFYELVWAPLDSLLHGVNIVYYSPYSLIHNISFDALQAADKKFLGEKYVLHRVGSTSQVLQPERPVYAKSLATACIFGGMNYTQTLDLKDCGAAGNTNSKEMQMNVKNRGLDWRGDSVPIRAWEPLHNTIKESMMICKLMEKASILVRPDTGCAATEAEFQSHSGNSYAGSPSIIHIATHGFSFPRPDDSLKLNAFENHAPAYRNHPDPLQRCGLVFSGANFAWLGGKVPDSLQDGIATGAEIAQLDLSNTQLVVLSACQSGIGEIQGAEGVFGLQRAFKLAGVELILATLWQVPDAETAEFMELFYTAFLKEGLEVRDAFFKAQAEMRERYRDEPYLWGAFVLLE